MNILSIVAMFVLVGVFSTAFSDNCHLRELDLCAASGAGTKKLPANDAEVDQYCGLAKEAKDCMKAYTKKCTTPLQKELISFATEHTEHLVDQFCTKGDQLRTGYLKHAPCLAKTQPDEKKCVTDVEAALEKLETAKFDERILIACCTYARYHKCSTDIVDKTCGKEAIEYGQLIVKMASGNLLNMMCQGFESNPACENLLPPPGTHPKGNGKSLVGKAFSMLNKS